MKLPNIIGISGKKGSGKTLLAHLILENYPEYSIKSFAYPLKKMTAELLDIGDMGELDKESVKMQPIVFCPTVTIRQLLQVIGTEVGRNLDPNFWVNYLFFNTLKDEKVIISDVRFPNEATAITERGGIIIRLVTEEDTKEPKDLHESETALDMYRPDITLYNNKTGQKEFYQAFVNAMETFNALYSSNSNS